MLPWMKWCRLCGREDDIIDTKSKKIPECYQRINKLLSIQIQKNETDIPSTICKSCHETLANFDMYAARCEKVQYMFRTLLKKTYTQSNNVDRLKAFRDGYLHSIDMFYPICDMTVGENPTENEASPQASVSNSPIKLRIQNQNESSEQLNFNIIVKEENDPLLAPDESNGFDNSDNDSFAGDDYLPASPMAEAESQMKNKSKLSDNGLDDSSLSCTKCTQKFSSESELKIHLITHLSNEKQSFLCCTCAKRFKTDRLLRSHEKEHNPPEEEELSQSNSFVLSGRGRNKYIHNGYAYVLDRVNTRGTIQFWRCEKQRLRCRARLWSKCADGSLVSTKGTHTCNEFGNPANIIRQQLKTALRRNAINSLDSAEKIREKVASQIPAEAFAALPSIETTKRMLRHLRRKTKNPPRNPTNLKSLIISDEVSQYEFSPSNFEQFLLADSGAETRDSERILIFGRQYNRSWARDMTDLYMDGTFKHSPPLFEQIFVVFAKKAARVIVPIFFCLLPNKKPEIYLKLFKMIQNMWPELQPTNIIVDLDSAIHSAIRRTYPNSEIHSCFFHLHLSLLMHVEASGLIDRYHSDLNIAFQCKMIAAIGFLPEEDIFGGVQTLEQYLMPELRPILLWFVTTYVGRVCNDGTREIPNFPSYIWSLYSQTLHGTEQTNHFTEACHRKLQLGFGGSRAQVNFWSFVDILKECQKTVDNDFAAILEGNEPPRKKYKFEQADKRIQNILENFDGSNVIEFLTGISNNFS